MCTPANAAHLAQTGGVVALVLEAERAALSEIEHFELQTMRLVVTSCLRAVLAHKRAEVRIARLRERMTAAAQLRRERVSSEMQALESNAGVPAPLMAPLGAAIAKVTAELAGIPESS